MPTDLDERHAEDSYLRQRGSLAATEVPGPAAHQVVTPFRARPATFAIIIPTHDRILSLARLLDSIDAQDVAPSEIVIVDQNPPGFLEPLLAEFRRLPIKHQLLATPNAAAARNLGFASSDANYVSFLDDDMELAPDYVRRMQECFAQYPAAGCIEPRVRPAGQRIDVPRSSKPSKVQRRSRIARTSCTLGAGGIAFGRKYFRAAGGFDELLSQGTFSAEVPELLLRMSKRGMSRLRSRDISVFHDPAAPTEGRRRPLPYRTTRKKMAWVAAILSRLTHPTFALRASGVCLTMLAVFLHHADSPRSWRRVLRNPHSHLQLMRSVMTDTHEFMQQHAERYADLTATNHLRIYEDLVGLGPTRSLGKTTSIQTSANKSSIDFLRKH